MAAPRSLAALVIVNSSSEDKLPFLPEQMVNKEKLVNDNINRTRHYFHAQEQRIIQANNWSEIDKFLSLSNDELENNQIVKRIYLTKKVGSKSDIIGNVIIEAGKKNYEVYWVEDAAIQKNMEHPGVHKIKSSWIPLIEQVHREAAKPDSRGRSSTGSTVSDTDAELKAHEPSSLLIAKLRKCDQRISRLEQSVEALWQNYPTIELAATAHTQLLRPILTAWNFVLHTIDQEEKVAGASESVAEKAWKDFLQECGDALKAVSSSAFADPRDTWRDKLFGEGHKKSLIREVRELRESAEDLLNFTGRFIISAARNALVLGAGCI